MFDLRKKSDSKSFFRITRIFILLFISITVASCSNESAEESQQESTVAENPLAALTYADNSSDAYKRSCYWGSENNNIFMYQRMQEGNELAEQEGKLPILGVEQAMEVVLRKGEPQAKKEYKMVKEFCAKLGFTFND
jgi:hypothetical protein